VITIRDPVEPARWARHEFEDPPPDLALLSDDPDPRSRPHVRLKVEVAWTIV